MMSFSRVRRQWLASLLTLLILGPLVAACDHRSPSPSPSQGPEDRPSAVAGEGVPRADGDNDGVEDGSDRCPSEAEDRHWSDGADGCPDGIDDLTTLAVRDLGAFWDQVLAEGSREYRGPSRAVGYDGPISTGCGTAVPENAFYCRADGGLYYHRRFLEQQLRRIGDYGPVFILAHEWGHLIQDNLGLLDDPTRLTIQQELQADCLAGVYTRSAEQRDLLEAGDLEEAVESLLEAGDPRGTPWYDPNAHGSSSQRNRAFAIGFSQGLQACLAI